MVVAAIVVDLLVLIAMIGRIGEYGASPNKLASLGLNLILLVNLAGAAWLQLRIRARPHRVRAARAVADRLHAGLSGVGDVVVVVFPPVFGYV